MTEMGLEGKVRTDARHLGGRYSWNGGNACELRMRESAMKKGWWEMGSFWWKPGTPREVKRLAFLTKVMSAAVSGMEGYSCSERECTSLDKVIVK